jgi:hypothetical protein
VSIAISTLVDDLEVIGLKSARSQTLPSGQSDRQLDSGVVTISGHLEELSC